MFDFLILVNAEREKMSKRYKGILCILAAAFCFAIMNASVRASGELPAMQKAFFRNIVALVCAYAVLKKSGTPVRWKKENFWLLFIRAAAGTIGVICNFYAVDHLVLSDATMLNKMSPFFAILFSFLLLKENLKIYQVVAVLGSFIGSLFIIKPTFSNMDLIPSLIGLVGGLGAGVAYTMVRKLGMKGENGEKGPLIVLFFSAFSCLVTLPYLLFFYQPMTWQQLLFLLLAGIAGAGGQFAITAAYTYAPARDISVYDYTQVIFSAVLGFFLFHQLPDHYSVIGYVLICGMGVYMFRMTRRAVKNGQEG